MSGCIAASEAVLVVLFVSSADLLVGFEVAFVLPEFRFAFSKKTTTTNGIAFHKVKISPFQYNPNPLNTNGHCHICGINSKQETKGYVACSYDKR